MPSNPADEHPPADGFGRDGVTWRPSADHDPIHIAALHVQHRLIAATRRAWSHLHPGSDLTGAAFAAVLDASLRPAEKRLAGQQLLQLADIARLVLYLGDDVLAAVPSHVLDMFPEPYRPLVGSWEPGRGILPTFRAEGPGGHHWESAVARLAGFLDTEADARSDHLLTTDAVAHALVHALDASGTDPSTIELDHRPAVDSASRTLVIGPHTNTTLAIVAYLPDRAGEPRELAERLGRILHAAASLDAEHRVLVLVADQAATRQLQTHLPEALGSPLSTQLTVSFPTLSPTPSPGDIPGDLDITILAREQHQPRSTVLALLLTKRR